MSAISVAKRLAKRALFESGALRLFQRQHLADTLTVLMFHRILPTSDPRFPAADPNYTMRVDVFERCMQALSASYNIVPLAQVEAAASGGARLPKCALLVTFDDGWKDTAQYAAPALRKLDIPGAVFIASSAVKWQLTLWKDVAACIWRLSKLTGSDELCGRHARPDDLIHWLEGLRPEERDQWLSAAIENDAGRIRPLMMSMQDVRDLPQNGVAVGAHGATHTPLTEVADLDGELARCAKEMLELTGSAPRTLAFPHGCYSTAIARRAAQAGYTLQFTSDPYLNRLRAGRLSSHLLGRIDMPERELVGPSGAFDPERLAYWLTTRPVREGLISAV